MTLGNRKSGVTVVTEKVLLSVTKIFVHLWARFLSAHRSGGGVFEYFLELVIGDYARQNYEYTSDHALKVLYTYGSPYWVSVDNYLDSPLPDWAIAALLVRAPNRFPRYLFGHEHWHFYRQLADRGEDGERLYTDIRRRAENELNRASHERRVAIVEEANRQQRLFAPLPLQRRLVITPDSRIHEQN